MLKINELKEMISNSNNIVFFGGAGTSTDSGIKDFRGKDGLYRQKKAKFPPEYMLSASCFYEFTEDFYTYYKNNMNCLSAKPNILHYYLKDLEDKGKLKAIITQNIDGLHSKAGSNVVYELHGTIHENYCLDCGKFYDADYVFSSKKVPKCSCGGVIKPKVVLYEEALPEEAFLKARDAIINADMLIVAGTSLTVEPASSLVRLFHGKHFVILNQDETPYDDLADLVIYDNLKKIFENL